ncbi:cytochrome C [Paracoccus onubensis]|uniref:Cytochrome C n=2 Tax=Paracoccus onubensis TaxID=1675788 RepID=A0A418SMB0_9RHOB|nr:cytochrome C [Paracoccus onubensis]
MPIASASETIEVKGYTGISQRGSQIYAQICSSCHSPDNNLVGPAHRGVFGRAAGKVEGYDYSPALGMSDIVWTADSLFDWLGDPDDFVLGSKMYVSLDDPQQRADVIAYLMTLK